MKVKGIIDKEEIGPKEIALKLGLNEASAKNISRNQNLTKLVIGKGSCYSLPNYNLRKVKELVMK